MPSGDSFSLATKTPADALAALPRQKARTAWSRSGSSPVACMAPQEVRMREVVHAGRDINDRYTRVLIEAHLAAAEQTVALIRETGKTAP